jgi:hypothetical protein
VIATLPTSAPTPNQAPLLPIVEKWISNAVLDAIRRPYIRSVKGTPNHIVIGASSIPNGPAPHEHARWKTGIIEAHPGLHLPTIGVRLTEELLDEARTACTQREWDDLHRIADQTSITRLYRIKEHHRTGWYAERNPLAGYAPGAALSILDLAMRTEDERGHSLVIWGEHLALG